MYVVLWPSGSRICVAPVCLLAASSGHKLHAQVRHVSFVQYQSVQFGEYRIGFWVS